MDWSSPFWEFCRMMGAVLAANLLTAMFLYAVVQYSKLERFGLERKEGNSHIWTMLFVLAFVGLGVMASGAWF